MQLQNFLNLRRDVLVVFLLKNLLDRSFELGVAHVTHLHAGVDVIE